MYAVRVETVSGRYVTVAYHGPTNAVNLAEQLKALGVPAKAERAEDNL